MIAQSSKRVACKRAYGPMHHLDAFPEESCWPIGLQDLHDLQSYCWLWYVTLSNAYAHALAGPVN